MTAQSRFSPIFGLLLLNCDQQALSIILKEMCVHFAENISRILCGEVSIPVTIIGGGRFI